MEEVKEKNPVSPAGKLVSGVSTAQMAKQSSLIPSSGISTTKVVQAPCGEAVEMSYGGAQTAANIGITSAVVENASQAKRTVDIATLSEDEVLSMMHGIVKGMVEFASNTKNVHRELKDKLKNTGLLLSQFLRLRKGSGAVPETLPGVQKVAADPQTPVSGAKGSANGPRADYLFPADESATDGVASAAAGVAAETRGAPEGKGGRRRA